MASLKLQLGLIFTAATFVILFVLLFLHHEHTAQHHDTSPFQQVQAKLPPSATSKNLLAAEKRRGAIRKSAGNQTSSLRMNFLPTKEVPLSAHHVDTSPPPPPEDDHAEKVAQGKIAAVVHENTKVATDDHESVKASQPLRYNARRGLLMCNGERVDSEIIYWKQVPGDAEYESPITVHHEEHHDRYLTFEYDQGGWNNVRMGMESLIVVAHATGRTLVIPPQQHLYLLMQKHADQKNAEQHDEMGFEDFFDLNLLRSHRGFHMMEMEDFMNKEAVSGGLHGILPPRNSSKVWGSALWNYLAKVADEKPSWMGRFLALPANSTDYDLTQAKTDAEVAERLKAFGGDRSPVFYDQKLQRAHHIHFPGGEHYRLLQHHYAFAFFADRHMQSFYRRFVRDYMRYKDEIQCAGAELVGAVRADARRLAPSFHGAYYALHIRRGDFQFKDVKISAADIVQNLHFPNGTAIIPRGAMVYISTDDPDGLCKNCLFNRKPCDSYPSPKPVGCPEDTTWKAFADAGWQVRFLRDYLTAGYLAHTNPNTHGMLESIVCSRATVFAGTYFSTFTGYIHRLRGYHGLGEATYYHHKNYVFHLQRAKSVGHGFAREWRAGWTDEAGELI